MRNEQIVVTNPATLEEVRERPVDVVSEATLEKMFAKARRAQREWRESSVGQRKRALRKIQRYFIWHYEELIKEIRLETGKVWPDAMLEPLSAVGDLAWLTWNAKNILCEETSSWPCLGLINRRGETNYTQALPVVGVITPWNLPLAIPAADIFPAILCGSAVIWKPSEYTPFTALKVAEIIQKLGCFPDGLLQVAPGYAETGKAIVERADGIAFTGSCDAGLNVMESCFRRQIPCNPEMSGQTPGIVWPPYNFERTVNAAVWHAFANSGAYCKALRLLIVARHEYERVVEVLVRRACMLLPGIDYGPIITAPQLEIIENRVARAVDGGAEVLCGGKRPYGMPGRYYEPTVIARATFDMELLAEETFGPVLAVMPADTLEEAISLANRSRYGLNGAVFTRSKKIAKQVRQELEVGNLNRNDCMMNWMFAGLPQCGTKRSAAPMSGIPRHGFFGARRFTTPRTYVEPTFPLPFSDWELWWYPYTESTEWALRFFIHTYWPFV
ncbi:MAG: aldehyde dehydrogenase family protein [Patescibacteria group bacterium]